jgi:hypothetical protein
MGTSRIAETKSYLTTRLLGQPNIVKPRVVVGWVLLHLLFVHELALVHNDPFDSSTVAVLFLVLRKGIEQLLRPGLWDFRQRELVDGPRPVVLLAVLFKSSKSEVPDDGC